MIATFASILAKVGLSFVGDLLLKWDAQRQQAKQDLAERSGAQKQAIADTANEAARQTRIAQAEAETDRTQAGVVEAARQGKF